jgi:hypothetical protein
MTDLRDAEMTAGVMTDDVVIVSSEVWGTGVVVAREVDDERVVGSVDDEGVVGRVVVEGAEGLDGVVIGGPIEQIRC